MAVDAVGTGYTIDEIVKKNENEKEKKAERNTGEMGKDEFLNLLVTQLQYRITSYNVCYTKLLRGIHIFMKPSTSPTLVLNVTSAIISLGDII